MASTNTSAARTVYNIAEIRKEILRHLPYRSLAAFIRVEKGCFEDVARELYRSVEKWAIGSRLSVDSIRERIYLGAVTKVNVPELVISKDIPPIPGWEQIDPLLRLSGYNKSAFNFVLPYLRHRFPNLCTVVFGGQATRSYTGRKRGACVVTFDPDTDAGMPPGITPEYDEQGYIGDLKAHISLRTQCESFLWLEDHETPSSMVQFPTSPSHGSYTISHRFDLFIDEEEGPPGDPSTHYHPSTGQDWRDAFQGGAGFENLLTVLKLDCLPISFNLLTRLYERQIAADHSERLAEITTTRLEPWDVDTFATFASVASTSLTSLHILGYNGDAWPTTSFVALPQIISIVRSSLPNLVKLAMGVKERMAAEALCAQFLRPDILDEGGSVTDLRIEVGTWPDDGESEDSEDEEYQGFTRPYFNVIRALSGLCTSKARISVMGIPRFRVEKDQTAYFQYLRRQPPHCKAHLALADFDSMGITTLREVLKLDYLPDGRPCRTTGRHKRDKTIARAWVEKLDLTMTAKQGITTGVQSCREAASRLDEVASDAPAWERLALAEHLIGAMEPLKAEIRRLDRSLDLEGVKRYAEELRAQVRRDGREQRGS